MKKLAFLFAALVLPVACAEDIKEEKQGSIIGVVADRTTGEPVGTVSLTLSPGGSKTVTGSDGTFQFLGLESGSYTIDLAKEGYKRESSSVVVFDGRQTDAHLLIERIPAVITVDRDELDFGDVASVTQLSFSIVNPGYLDLHWSVSWDRSVTWIKEIVGPDGKSEGTLGFGKTASLLVRIEREALLTGTNEAIVVIWSDNGRSELKVLATGFDGRPSSNVLPVTDLSMTSVTLNAELISKGSPEYSERGFVVSSSSISSIDGLMRVTSPKTDQMKYSASLTGLQKGAHYFVRSYAKNDIGLKLSSNEIEFTTLGNLTEVETRPVSNLDVIARKVQLNGKIVNVGAPAYSERGFVYNTTGEPSIRDSRVTVSGNGSGDYSYPLAGLNGNTTYYVRAYAIQNGTEFYGTTVNFSTNQTATEVSTSAASSITSSTAILNGSIVTIGVPPYTEKGFCYSSTNFAPTLASSKVVVSNNETNFSAKVESLPYGREIYYRAYAIQNGSPVYGNVVSFTTVYNQTVVSTSAASSVTSSTAILNGSVIDAGSPSYTEKGFCYSNYKDTPSISDSKVIVSGTGAGNYQKIVENLSYNTTYRYRAYAIQDGNPVYGAVVSFATTYTVVGVTTGAVSNIKYTTARLSGTITNVGDPKYTERGFCYGTSQAPTISNLKVSNYVVNTGNWTADITGLTPGTTYYIRAYAIQDGVPVYGNQTYFNTNTQPVVETNSVSNLTKVDMGGGFYYQWRCTFNGYVRSAGNPAYTSRGFVYGTSYGVTVGSGTSVSASGTGVGNYSSTVTNLSDMKTYYVRAWVRTSSGEYIYGESVSFSTY
ncbi:MAG: carboxypeptidase regulatory-like domain-containing protein [Bacteroidales bacterium]|nr:carboxypeptidase regulatory-like domain-containing protein [Bacteroidales bacterium]